MATKIQFRRGTQLEWDTADPVLSSGEVGFETDSARFKIGDGSSNWSELSYFYNDFYVAKSASAYALSQANSYTDAEISALIDTAPGALDTLNELAAALGDDSNFASSIATTYLTKSSASTTYLTQSSASTTYLTQSSASTTYAPLASPNLTGTATAVNLTTSGTVTNNGPLILATGASATLPLTFPTATALTTSLTNGGTEYDGKVLYFTPNSTSGRALVETQNFFRLSSTRTLVNDTSSQSLFGVGITLVSGTSYEFEINAVVSTSGATSNSLRFLVGGTAVITGIEYFAQTTNSTAIGTPSTISGSYFAVTTASSITAAVAAATQRFVKINGVVRITTGGTFIPQISYSATPGAAPTVSAGSYIKIMPIGTNSVTTVGQWA